MPLGAASERFKCFHLEQSDIHTVLKARQASLRVRCNLVTSLVDLGQPFRLLGIRRRCEIFATDEERS